jgi:plastocyanin
MGRVITAVALTMALVSSGGCRDDHPAARPAAVEEERGVASRDTSEVESHRIEIRMTDDMRFEPENPVVAVGDTVVWINVGAMPHTTTDEPGRAGVPDHNVLPAGASTWDSGLMNARVEFRAVLKTPGEYTYLCTLHEVMGMVGRITVR